MPDNSQPLVAVDIGNTRIKLGVFEPSTARQAAESIPSPARTLAVGHEWPAGEIETWLAREAKGFYWAIASVNRPAGNRLLGWLAERGVAARMLADTDVPLAVEVPRPDQVGIDRLLDALAANRLRNPARAAIVVGFGTALTFNLISRQGAYQGGAIAPGVQLAAHALHEFTDLLPLVEVVRPAEPLGTDTIESISSGIYWGTVGAIREMVARLNPGGQPCDLFLTGGAAEMFAEPLAGGPHRVRLEPHLTLAGIALSVGGDSRDGANHVGAPGSQKP